MGSAEMIELNTVEDLEDVITRSTEGPKLVFKHSVTCSISRGVFNIVSGISEPVFLVVVQSSRNVSDAVAVKTGIKHESPQALVFDNGKCVYSASHYDITADALRSHL